MLVCQMLKSCGSGRLQAGDACANLEKCVEIWPKPAPRASPGTSYILPKMQAKRQLDLPLSCEAIGIQSERVRLLGSKFLWADFHGIVTVPCQPHKPLDSRARGHKTSLQRGINKKDGAHHQPHMEEAGCSQHFHLLFRSLEKTIQTTRAFCLTRRIQGAMG